MVTTVGEALWVEGFDLDLLERLSDDELDAHLKDEDACRRLFLQMKWPDGFVCPHCGYTEAWKRRDRDVWKCARRGCKREVSLRSKTILRNSPKTYRKWFLAMRMMTGSKQGTSALRLMQRTQMPSYQTPLRWLRELRRAMSQEVEKQTLSGEVEIDEGFLRERNKVWNQKAPKLRTGRTRALLCVVGMVESGLFGTGRARLTVIDRPNADGARARLINALVREKVQPGTIIRTDGSSVYGSLPDIYFHDPRTVTQDEGDADNEDVGSASAKHLPRINLIFSLLRRLLMGANQGTYSRRHLQLYLDEYCFRFNNRSGKPNSIFLKLIKASTAVTAVPYWYSSGRKDPKVPTRVADATKMGFSAYGAILRGF